MLFSSPLTHPATLLAGHMDEARARAVHVAHLVRTEFLSSCIHGLLAAWFPLPELSLACWVLEACSETAQHALLACRECT